jgi:serine/threonine protein kinase
VSDAAIDDASGPSEDWGLTEGDEIAPGRIALEELGGGYDFQAYLAWDDHLHALVVAKCVRPHLVADPSTMRHVAREAATIERLAHPVVMRGFGAVLEPPRPHLVLEHLEGPTLASTIRRFGPLALHQLLPLGFQLASALAYLANEDTVHLDVKPRNVILGAPPRLIDLSIARTSEEASAIRTPVGTDAYMAPEQCDPSLASVGPPADVWGLGATLFHAVAGEVPFPRPKDHDREDPEQRWPQLAWSPGPLPEETPRPLADVIDACLQPVPGDRPCATEVALGLEPLIGDLKRERILGRPRPRIR